MPDTILIADDEFEIRTIWEDRLKTAGYAVKSAKNKADVLEKFFGLNTKTETASKQGTYALVLLDIRMPSSATSRKINPRAGLEAAMQIRASDPDVPVLFISGSEDDEVQAKTLELHGKGAVDFVLKPCGEKAFHARIKKMARTNVFPFGPHAVIEKNTRNAIARIQDAAGHWTTQTTQLTPMLFELVTVFMGNKGRLLNKTQLLAKWGYEEKSLVQAIFELRKAIADSKLDIIKTLRGEGYIYNSPDA